MTVEFEMDADKVFTAFSGMTAAVRIAYTVEYAVYVEFPTSYSGTQPPFQPIFEWVQRKWADLGGGIKDAGLSDGIQPGSEQHQKAVAWVVVKAIAKNGTEGVFFGKRSVAKGRQKAGAIARQYQRSDDPDAGRKIIEDIGDLMFEESQRIVSQEATDTGNLLQSGQIEFFTDPDEVSSEA